MRSYTTITYAPDSLLLSDERAPHLKVLLCVRRVVFSMPERTSAVCSKRQTPDDRFGPNDCEMLRAVHGTIPKRQPTHF